MATFKHSGKIGDVIYSLPTLRALGGGSLLLSPNAQLEFSEQSVRSLVPLLALQPYINSADIWKGEPVDFDLDRFRLQNYQSGNLADCHLEAFGLRPENRNSVWLRSGEVSTMSIVVFGRSLARRGVQGFWQKAYAELKDHAVLVGTGAEHEGFERDVGPVQYRPTRDMAELAAVIASCSLFVGNQSAPYAIAEALKKTCIQETDLGAPNCIFDRAGALQVVDAKSLAQVSSFILRQLGPPAEFITSLLPELPAKIAFRGEFSRTEIELMGLGYETLALTDGSGDCDSLLVHENEFVSLPVESPPKSIAHARTVIAISEMTSKEASAPAREVPIGSLKLRHHLAEHLFRPVRATTAWRSSLNESYVQAFLAKPIEPWTTEEVGRLGSPSIEGTSIVILTYNSMSSIDECLEAVTATIGRDDELVIVDNGSIDGTAQFVRDYAEARGDVRAILNGRNLGFTAGTNAGIRASRGRTIALLNPDAVVESGWLDSLRSRFEVPRIGAVGPVSDNVTRDQYVEHHLTGDCSGLTRWQLSQRLKLQNRGLSKETKLLIGFCLMLRRDVLDQVGLLDEDLFLGSDDLELSLRIRSHGYRLIVARDVFVRHLGGVSFRSLKQTELDRALAASTAQLWRKIDDAFAPGTRPTELGLWGVDFDRPASPPGTGSNDQDFATAESSAIQLR